MRRAFFTLSTATILLAVPMNCLAQDVQAIVDQFYPDRLAPMTSEDRRSCYSVLRTTTGGEPDVIAAGYTDVSDAILRLLTRVGPSSYVLAYETPTTISMIGMTCSVTTVDLDGNGQPDVHLKLSFGKGTSDWMFRWTGSTLTNLTPTYTEDQRQYTELVSSALFDLYHDGTLQVVSGGNAESDGSDGIVLRTPHKVFRLGAAYQFDSWLVAVARFRVGADPRANGASFVPVVDSQAPFTVRIVNGDRTGQKRVSGGSLTLNGVEIVSAGQLTDQVEYLTRTVSSVSSENRLVATITGAVDAELLVTVSDSTSR